MASPFILWCSRANWLAAASTWRRLLMQALQQLVERALMKFGTPITAAARSRRARASQTTRLAWDDLLADAFNGSIEHRSDDSDAWIT